MSQAALELITTLRDAAAAPMHGLASEIEQADQKAQHLQSELNKTATAEEHVGQKAHEAGGHMKEAGEGGESLIGKLGGIGMAATGIGFAAEGALDLGKNIEQAFEKANEAQASFGQLDNTLKNNVKGWDGNKEEIEKYVNSQKLMGFSTEEINQSLGNLTMTTHNLEEAQNLQGLAMDLARAKHIPLETATKLLTKADMDSASALTKMGIEVDKGATKEQLLAAVHNATAGAAQQWSETSQGAAAKFGAVMDTLQEQVAGAVMPGITDAMTGVANFISGPDFQGIVEGALKFLGDAFGNLQSIIGTVASFVQQNAVPVVILLASIILSQAVPAFIAWATTMLTTTLPALAATVGAALAAAAPFLALGAVLAGLYVAFQTNFLGIGDLMRSVWSIVQPIIQPFIDAFQTFFSTVTSGGSIMDALGTLFSNLGAAIQSAGPKIGPALQQIGALLWQWVQDAAPKVMSALGTLFGTIIGWIAANGPGILAQLATWATAFAGWVLGTALPALLSALGGLIGSVWNWIVANGPGIMNQLLIWAKAFSDWVLNTALPALLSALGSLVSSVWNWIVANGPGIMQQLLTWATAFSQWVLGTALPALLQALGSLIGSLWNWIVANGPGILQQLAVWATQFAQWVTGSAIPWLLQKLGDLIGALWNWITTNAPTILAKLQEWANQFMNWVQTQVLPNLPTWLGNIASAIWTWLTTTAGDLGNKLVTQWIPAFMNWINGPGGVKDTIGTKLGEVAQAIWTWITTTAGDAFKKVLAIGQNIVDGIKKGIGDAWQGFLNWIGSMLDSLPQVIKDFFHIGSPSKLMADEIGMPLALGIGVGFGAAWDSVTKEILDKVKKTQQQARDQAGPGASVPGDYPGTPSNPRDQPGPGASAPGDYPGAGYSSPGDYPGGRRGNAGARDLPPGAGASSGGTGARSFATGFGGGFGGGGGTTLVIETLNIYPFPGMDPSHFASSLLDELDAQLSTNVRTRRAGQ